MREPVVSESRVILFLKNLNPTTGCKYDVVIIWAVSISVTVTVKEHL